MDSGKKPKKERKKGIIGTWKKSRPVFTLIRCKWKKKTEKGEGKQQ